MEHTIYLDFEENDIPIDIYSVKLSTENPSSGYGIFDITSQSIVVVAGTVVSPYQTGRYSYTFTVENGHTYMISWEIIANEGENPTYRNDQVGPFFSVNNSSVRASSSYTGKFVQDSIATIMLKITDFEGMAIDAENIDISIYDFDGIAVTLTNTLPEHVDTGYYVYDWTIGATQTPGEYTIIWSYVVDDIQKAEIQKIIVVEDATNTGWYSGRTLDFKIALEHHLACAQSIPIYYEQSKPSRNNKVYRFTFPRWNQSADVKIYRNDMVINSGVEVDYFTGKVTFDNTLLPYETVNADYNFKWFTDDELYRFLINSLNALNNYPPHSDYTLYNVPDRYTTVVLYGATKDALRHLMMCIQFQQPAQVFGGLENAQKAFANFETIKQNYEKDWEKLVDQKKFGPWPSMKMVVTPEYTLPGGRSLHLDTELLVIVNTRVMNMAFAGNYQDVYTRNNNVINNYQDVYTRDNNTTGNDVQVCTLREIYELFRNGYDIEILSQSNLTGNLIFVPINYVWESGIKTVYNLETSNGYNVKTSDEHLFYINGKYIPLRDIKIGDEIITCDNHNWEISTVKSINQLKRKEIMYDLEVFGTANLFANGIKCHNSRWFRYLFK